MKVAWAVLCKNGDGFRHADETASYAKMLTGFALWKKRSFKRLRRSPSCAKMLAGFALRMKRSLKHLRRSHVGKRCPFWRQSERFCRWFLVGFLVWSAPRTCWADVGWEKGTFIFISVYVVGRALVVSPANLIVRR